MALVLNVATKLRSLVRGGDLCRSVAFSLQARRPFAATIHRRLIMSAHARVIEKNVSTKECMRLCARVTVSGYASIALISEDKISPNLNLRAEPAIKKLHLPSFVNRKRHGQHAPEAKTATRHTFVQRLSTAKVALRSARPLQSLHKRRDRALMCLRSRSSKCSTRRVE